VVRDANGQRLASVYAWQQQRLHFGKVRPCSHEIHWACPQLADGAIAIKLSFTLWRDPPSRTRPM
jgi:hypothetical protein